MASPLVKRVVARAKEADADPEMYQIVQALENQLTDASTKTTRATTREELNEAWDMLAFTSRFVDISHRMERMQNSIRQKLQRMEAEAIKTKGKTYNLSPDDLELYDEPGANRAAKAISTALNKAAKELLRKLDKLKDSYEDDRDAKKVDELIYEMMKKHVGPVLEKYRDFGATDSEPPRHVQHRLISLAKGYLGEDRFSQIGNMLW